MLSAERKEKFFKIIRFYRGGNTLFTWFSKEFQGKEA